ncbi:hypothetical protein PAMP_018847 [Pampus punctatissimus]
MTEAFEKYHLFSTNLMTLSLPSPFADCTTSFEPLSAASSEEGSRAGCSSAQQVLNRHLLQGHRLFLDRRRITLRLREDPSDRKSPSTPPSSFCILGPQHDRLNAGWWFNPVRRR